MATVFFLQISLSIHTPLPSYHHHYDYHRQKTNGAVQSLICRNNDNNNNDDGVVGTKYTLRQQ